MGYLIFAGVIVGVLAVVFLISMIWIRSKNAMVVQRIRSEYGMVPEFEGDSRDFESVKDYYRMFPSKDVMDDITWNDLDMDSVYKRINNTQSSIGDSYLYATMRDQSARNLNQVEEHVSYFSQHPSERLEIQTELRRIGKITYNGCLDFIHNPRTYNEHLNIIYTIMRILAVLGIAMIFIRWELAIALISLTAIINFAINESYSRKIQSEAIAMGMLVAAVNASRAIAKLNLTGFEQQTKTLTESNRVFQGINMLSGFAIISASTFNLASSPIGEILGAYFLLTPLSFDILVKRFNNHSDAAMDLYTTLGYIETMISVASYRESLDNYCQLTQSDVLAPVVAGVIHPLIEKGAIGNTVTLHQRNIITGSNASGKSTFVKAIALNTHLGQIFNTCLATSFEMRQSFIVTSMAIRDDIESGDSYFVSETKSIKRIIDEVNSHEYSFVVIDEILKGTNTIERIAASASILNALQSKPCFVCAATHDIELTEMMANSYHNYHFRETIEDSAINFDYTIYEGPSNTRNAIQLLEFMGYDAKLVAIARELAEDFTIKRTWNTLDS
ncbi:hypothetical protein G7062_01415 [Erysipelothrix sp. HDW6C]|uniref:MutS-related protein n=1 Tax=Erysipelothrix sp. HDW6C TaxID=2714930 RepID=UPI00140BF093|nr:hypothetical protein [Erysipelothrix sp. HDW6C]QIK69021.1 hypothetical protein G7062_01415 [Erysipelothrix sp. HDW6C]